MREQDLEQYVGRDPSMSLNHALRLQKLLQMMQWSDDLIAHGYDEIFADDKVNFLALGFSVVCPVRREMQNEKRHILIADYKRHRSGIEKLLLYVFADGKFFRHLPYVVFARLFKINPNAVQILVPEYHAFSLPRVC